MAVVQYVVEHKQRQALCCIIHFVKGMSGSALGYWNVYRTASLEKYWFLYFAASFRLHPLASACIRTLVHRHWIKVTGDCDSFPHPSRPSWHAVSHWQGLHSRVLVPKSWSSPGDQLRGNECRGDQHALGGCWALRVLLDICDRFLIGWDWGLKGSHGEKCAEGLDRCDVVHFVAHLVALLLESSTTPLRECTSLHAVN